MAFVIASGCQTRSSVGAGSYSTIVSKPAGKGPFPVVFLLHGCGGQEYSELGSHASNLTDSGFIAVEVLSSVPVGNCDNVQPYEFTRGKHLIAAREQIQKIVPEADISNAFILGQSQGASTGLWFTSKSGLEQLGTSNPFRGVIAYYPVCARMTDIVISPTLVFVGDKDEWTPHWLCKGQPKEVEVYIYPGAYHAFDRMLNSSYGGHILEYNRDADHHSRKRYIS